MNIAVLMTCHNRRETTMRCIKSLVVSCQSLVDLHLDLFLVDDVLMMAQARQFKNGIIPPFFILHPSFFI